MAAQPIPDQLVNITEKELKNIKLRDSSELFIKMQPIVYRANRFANQHLPVGKFVGSLESAEAYQNQANAEGIQENPHLGRYEMPQGYYMILNSATRIDQFNAFFARLLAARQQDRTDIINLHILLRVACGMSKESTQASIIEGYSQADLDNLKAVLLQRHVRVIDARVFDMNRRDLKPTRISLYKIDQYMAQLASTYLSGEQEVLPGKIRHVCGIITSCRNVGESVQGTNAMIFQYPGSVAVPGELITLVPLNVGPNGGKRSRKSRQRTRKHMQKSRKRIKRRTL
jgi:hypothetical protein